MTMYTVAMRAFLAFGALSLSCGGSQSSGTSVDCEAVAAHLTELSMDDNEATERPADMDGVESEMVRQCRDQEWSKERRTCLRAAGSQEQTLGCPRE